MWSIGDVTIDGDVNGDDTPDITIDGAGVHPRCSTSTAAPSTLNGLDHHRRLLPATAAASRSGPTSSGRHADVTISNSTLASNYADVRRRHLGRSRQLAAAHQLHRVATTQADYAGGGIANAGTLTVINSVVSGNVANLAGYAYSGGGLYNVGSATVIGSTISDNDGG